MQNDHQRLLHELLTESRLLSLAILVDGKPLAGLLPFVIRPDFGSLLVHASDLARHSRGLTEGASFAVLIHTPERAGLDPLQHPRVSLEGTVAVLHRDSLEYESGRELYLSRFPASAQTFALGDFHLYELALEKGRFVGGFGQAATVTRDILRELGGGGS